MPRVSTPGDLGVGRGAGKLGALGLPQRRATATPETFGAGIRNYAPGPEAFGGQTIAPQIQPGKSGFELLADTVSKVAAVGFETALAVDHANAMASIQQSNLQNRTEWLQQSLATEATIEEGANPGDYAKNASAAFDDFKAKKLEGLSGLHKQAVEQDLGELAMHNMDRATEFQGQRARQYRQAQNEITFAATQDQYHSAYNLAFTDPGQMPALLSGAIQNINTTHLPEDQKAKLRRDVTGGLAEAQWQGRLAQGDPYAVKDAMMRGNPAELGGLEYSDRQRILAKADVDINALEAEARARQAEAKAAAREARTALELNQRFAAYDARDHVQRLTDAIEVGLPVEGVGDVTKTLLTQAQAALDPDVKRALLGANEELQAAIDTSDYAKTFRALSLPEQRAEYARLKGQAVDPNEATPEARQFVAAGKILDQQEQAVADGKVLEAAQLAGQITLSPVDPGNPDSVVKRENDARMAAARVGTAGQPQRLTKNEAAAIAVDINGASTSDEVLQKMNGYLSPLDESARRAWLSELEQQKLSPSVRFAMEASYGRQDIVAARDILTVMSIKPEDLAKVGDATAKDITEAVNAEMTSASSAASLTAERAYATQQPGLQTRVAAERDLMLKLTSWYVTAKGEDAATAAKHAAASTYGTAAISGNLDIGRVTTPKNDDPDEFTRVLDMARAAAVLPEFYPKVGASYAEEQDRQRQLDRIRTGGVWTDDENGTFTLLDPTSHRKVATYTADDLKRLAATRAATGLPPPGTAMPLSTIFGTGQ